MYLYGDELYHAQVKIKFMLCYVIIEVNEDNYSLLTNKRFVTNDA